jgi:hypothetical protein
LEETTIMLLKNGSEETESAVKITMLSLKWFMEQPFGAITVYELVQLCRGPHELFGNHGDKLKEAGLLQDDGSVHETIRNIVLSAADGEGLELQLVNPVKIPT